MADFAAKLQDAAEASTSTSPNGLDAPSPPSSGYLNITAVIDSFPYYTPGFLDFLRPHVAPGQKVLQLGCRRGRIARELATIVGPRGFVTGVVCPGRSVQQAQEYVTGKGISNASFYNFPTLERLPFPDNTFDVVFASDIMIRLPDMEDGNGDSIAKVLQLLREMKRVARPGGCIASRDLWFHLFVPNYDLSNMFDKTLRQASKINLDHWYGEKMRTYFSHGGMRRCKESMSLGPGLDPAKSSFRKWANNMGKVFGPDSHLREGWGVAGARLDIADLIAKKLEIWGNNGCECNQAYKEVLSWKKYPATHATRDNSRDTIRPSLEHDSNPRDSLTDSPDDATMGDCYVGAIAPSEENNSNPQDQTTDFPGQASDGDERMSDAPVPSLINDDTMADADPPELVLQSRDSRAPDCPQKLDDWA
ncbi:S-adenosyl-L-methionine-dependent methyltransferase [Astrocystis sublimbata]|nr:S-adenosyl-L-methionine-dependent methyltransferase [Astrocystis sublimbata]